MSNCYNSSEQIPYDHYVRDPAFGEPWTCPPLKSRSESPALYYQGIARVLADICRLGHVSLVAEVLCDNNITIGELEAAQVDASDLIELREALCRSGSAIGPRKPRGPAAGNRLGAA
jgi:hypothetical protein